MSSGLITFLARIDEGTPISLVVKSDWRRLMLAPVSSVINRYYDPSTDQFLSIDPDVTTTDQPYAFTNDDPLNAEDPLGQKPKPIASSVVNAFKNLPAVTSSKTAAVNVGIFEATITVSVSVQGKNAKTDISISSKGEVDVNVGTLSSSFSAYDGTISSSGNVTVFTTSKSATTPAQRITITAAVSNPSSGGFETGVVTAGAAGSVLVSTWWLLKPVCAPAGPIGLVVC
jgi:hypothetical protein